MEPWRALHVDYVVVADTITHHFEEELDPDADPY
jgi:hypothetical protein